MPSRASRYGWNCGSSAASSATRRQTLPEARQNRVVALVERRVALRRTAARRARRSPAPAAARRARRLRAGLERRAFELGQLERQQLLARASRSAAAMPRARAELVAGSARMRVERRRRRAPSAARAAPKASSTPRWVDGIEQRLMLVLAVELDQARGRGPSRPPAVASAPLTNARLRPCAVISRRTRSSSPPLSKMASIAGASLRRSGPGRRTRGRRAAGRRPRRESTCRRRSRRSGRSGPARTRPRPSR